ncbi:MAG: MBL fold metallo-hydrolase [Propionibacteriaceae bacterium]
MELTVVGCSGSVSAPDNPSSCYLVQAQHLNETFSLVLDLGPGAYGALPQYVDPADVNAVALSHLHPDHCLDLCAFHVAGRHSPTAPWPRIDVWGPTDTAERIARAYDPEGATPDALAGLGEQFDFRVWNSQQVVGPFRISTLRVAHPVEAYAIRVDEIGGDKGSLVYSGDTGPCPELGAFCRAADLFLCEAGFAEDQDNPPGVHLSGSQAGQIAQDAELVDLVLTHIPPWFSGEEAVAAAESTFAGTVHLAEPGARWTVGAAAWA